ncbi:unnamed protein product [Moneuplotes crassus]|uniref:Uncharacterized protein n=1 Tax=Euplotes crassus TaxID=5936 RepID=A0AAD1XB07_EUPCR|nr:unnamed protein product [Moneuplotes crassus]
MLRRSQPPIVRKELLTTLSLASKILPYYGFADECQMLMTQFRRASRTLWNLKKHILLRNDPEEQGKTCFLLKKPLKIYIIIDHEFLKSRMTDLVFYKFMESGFSELYQLEIKIEIRKFMLVKDIKGILGDINMRNVTIKNIACSYHKACRSECSLSEQLYLLLNLSNLFGLELETREFGGCKYFIPPKIFDCEIDCPMFRVDEDGKIDYYVDYPVLGSENLNLYCDLAQGGLSVTDFCAHLDTVTIQQVCERIITSNFNLIMPGENIKHECDALMTISEKLKDWQQDAQKYPSRLEQIKFDLSRDLDKKLFEDSEYFLKSLTSFLQSCKQKSLSVLCNKWMRGFFNSKFCADLGFVVVGKKVLVMNNLECYCTREPTIEKNFILSHWEEISLKCQITDIIPLDNIDIDCSILKPCTIIIPRDQITKVNCDI